MRYPTSVALSSNLGEEIWCGERSVLGTWMLQSLAFELQCLILSVRYRYLGGRHSLSTTHVRRPLQTPHHARMPAKHPPARDRQKKRTSISKASARRFWSAGIWLRFNVPLALPGCTRCKFSRKNIDKRKNTTQKLQTMALPKRIVKETERLMAEPYVFPAP